MTSPLVQALDIKVISCKYEKMGQKIKPKKRPTSGQSTHLH